VEAQVETSTLTRDHLPHLTKVLGRDQMKIPGWTLSGGRRNLPTKRDAPYTTRPSPWLPPHGCYPKGFSEASISAQKPAARVSSLIAPRPPRASPSPVKAIASRVQLSCGEPPNSHPQIDTITSP